MKPDYYDLLYADETGEIVGLDEVQLMDPPPVERFPAVRALLREDDEHLVFEAAIVLAAWGDTAGLERIEQMIDMRIHERATLAPHRLHGYDNVYDELANAVSLFGMTTPGHEETIKRLYRKLLALYGPCIFESKLKRVLLKSDMQELTDDVLAAIERAWKLDRAYLASQLLPVLARWSPEHFWRLAPQFVDASDTPPPAFNVLEGLGYVTGPGKDALLKKLSTHPDERIASAAREQAGT